MKAIQTKYLGPTTYKGARIRAWEPDGKSVTISYPYELSGEAVHRVAAEALRDKLGWRGELVSGSLSEGYVFIFNQSVYAATTRRRRNDHERENQDV